jgi:hypothetical protein
MHGKPGDATRRKTRNQRLILKALSQYGMLKLTQISDATGLPYNGVSKTVALMKEKGHLGWCRWNDTDTDTTVRGPIVATQAITMSSQGRKEAIKRGIIEESTPVLVRGWSGQVFRMLKGSHDFGVVDVMISMRQALANHDTLEMVEIVNEIVKVPHPDIEGKTIPITAEKMSTGKWFVPDARFMIRNKKTGAVTAASFEFERTSNSSVVDKAVPVKFKNYQTLFSGDRDLKADISMILYAVSVPSRLKKVLAYEDAYPLRGVLRVGSMEDVKRDPLGMVWTRAVAGKPVLEFKPWSPVTG